MQVRRSPGGNITNEEWWALAALRIGSVVQRWRDWHAADRPDATRACGGGKNAVNETRRSMRFKCSEMGVEIHPLRLPLLLINVRHPYQRRTACLERGENLWHEQMRDDARVERAWAEHDQVGLLNGPNRGRSCSRPFGRDAHSVDVSRARELRLTPNGRAIRRGTD